MTEIQEVPLDIPEKLPDIQETQPYIEPAAPPAEEEIEERPKPKAKPKGRPKGSLNKGPSKPRKKVTVQEEDEDAPPAYEPSSPRRNLKIPEFGVNDVAVEMLRLLSNQQQARQQRKRELYQSWFN